MASPASKTWLSQMATRGLQSSESSPSATLEWVVVAAVSASRLACQLPRLPIVGYEGGRYYRGGACLPIAARALLAARWSRVLIQQRTDTCTISRFAGCLLYIAPSVVRHGSRVALQFSPIMNNGHTNLGPKIKVRSCPLLKLLNTGRTPLVLLGIPLFAYPWHAPDATFLSFPRRVPQRTRAPWLDRQGKQSVNARSACSFYPSNWEPPRRPFI
jgi:hypothetical protein